MPLSYPYIQYGGIWTTSQATDAVAATTWPVPPQPHLFTWGYNVRGQLGTGNFTYYSSPKQIGSLTNWITIAAGYAHSLAVKTDGTLWAWGRNVWGQLGDGTGGSNAYNKSSPIQIGALTNWLTVTGGYQFSAAVKTDGTLWAWGQNTYGQLGNNNTSSYYSPLQVGSGTNWTTVAASVYSTAALKSDGTLWTWGDGTYGVLGLGNTTSYSSPKQVGSLTNWSKLYGAAYNRYYFAIKTDGTLWCWGRNEYGQLGLGNQTYYSSPKQVGSGTNWASVSIQCYGTYAIKTDGTLWVWGAGQAGGLGLGNATNYSSPKQLGALTTWGKATSGYLFAGAIKTTGELFMWGLNNLGQLGLGNTTYSFSSPQQVGSLSTWISAFSGTAFTMAIAKT